VFDFGISKVTVEGALQPSLTRTMAVMGSPGYASPEQLRSTKSVDHRTDVWALGVTLYQLVSGIVPWTADTLPELSIKIAVDPAPPLSPALGVPAAFERIIQRCLEKDAARRFPTIAALAEALGPFAVNGAVAVERVRRASVGQGGHIAGTTLQGSAGEMAPRSRGRGRLYGVIGGLLIAGGVAAAAIVGSRAGTTPPSVDAPPSVTPPPVVTFDAAVVVTAPIDARQAVVVSPPDAPPAVVVATPDAGAAGTAPPTDDDKYAELIDKAARLRRTSCDAAARIYESAIDLRPRGHEAFTGLGTCLLERKDYDRAIGNFRAALAINKRYPEALIGAAEAYQRKGRVPEAIEHYERYLKAAPHGSRADVARRSLESLRRGDGGSDDDLFGNEGKKTK
jgi:tetratricopeptide (TPR) repeat protein